MRTSARIKVDLADIPDLIVRSEEITACLKTVYRYHRNLEGFHSDSMDAGLK